MIGGLVLMIYGLRVSSPIGLAAGLILATIKFQEMWLLLLLLPILLLRWKPAQWIKAAAIYAAPVALSMILCGRAWITALLGERVFEGQAQLTDVMGRGSLIDISLSASLQRIGISRPMVVVFWILLIAATLSIMTIALRRKEHWSHANAAFLISASILLAP